MKKSTGIIWICAVFLIFGTIIGISANHLRHQKQGDDGISVDFEIQYQPTLTPAELPAIGEAWVEGRFVKFTKADLVDGHDDYVKLRHESCKVINQTCWGDTCVTSYGTIESWIKKSDMFYYDDVYEPQREKIKGEHRVKFSAVYCNASTASAP